jgi:hypothetical protein
MKYNRGIVFGAGIALSLLMNGFTSLPYNSVDVNVNEFTIPLFTFIFILFDQERPRFYKTEMIIIIPLILSYIINIDFGSISWIKVGMHFVCGLAILGKVNSKVKLMEFLKGFTYTFAMICMLIYVYRFGKYNGDIIRIRSGINIWGGNVLFIFSLLGAIISIKHDKLFFNISIAIAALTSIIFINRMAIVLSLTIVFVLLSFRWKIFAVITTFLIIPKFSVLSKDYTLIEAILLRFSGSNPTGTREHIWREAFSLFLNRPLTGVGFGSYGTVGSQTSAHSLPLNVLAESGIFLGTMILGYLILKYGMVIANSYNRIGFIVMILYTSLFVTFSIAGEKLIQASGYGNAMIFVLLILSFRKFPNRQVLIKYDSQSI